MKSRRNVLPRDLALTAEDNMVRNRWPLGCVVEVFTVQDGGVRSAGVKTASGVYQHPVTKIRLQEEASDEN